MSAIANVRVYNAADLFQNQMRQPAVSWDLSSSLLNLQELEAQFFN